MKKLGHRVSPSYVRDVLKRHGISTAPNRKGMLWKQFIESHMDLTWATDLFTEEVWTLGGLVTCYVLFFIHLRTRRVWIDREASQRQSTTSRDWQCRPAEFRASR